MTIDWLTLAIGFYLGVGVGMLFVLRVRDGDLPLDMALLAGPLWPLGLLMLVLAAAS